MNSNSETDLKQLLSRILTLLFLLTVVGTLGYVLIEDWSIFNAFYMVIITITTTGYGEVFPLSGLGRTLSIFLMVAGVGTFFYGLNVIIPALVGRRVERWKRMIENIEDHYLLCGFGDIGKEIAIKLSERVGKEKILIIDQNPNHVSLAREKGYLSLQGQSSSEEILTEARVEHARAILTAVEDSENAFTIVVAKDLHPGIYAVGVAQSESGLRHIKRAGADYVLSPYLDVAKKASMLLQNPVAADFAEIISEIAEVGMLEKITLKDSGIAGQTLKELDLRKKTGSLAIAVTRAGEVMSPTPDLTLREGDNIYLIGDEEELRAAREILVTAE